MAGDRNIQTLSIKAEFFLIPVLWAHADLALLARALMQLKVYGFVAGVRCYTGK